ncbi:histone deacetylase complex subunit SAP30L isoform X1 [Electrophorus electricus]|uniref:histone deacetylase complex subunit SAP30L isoform X1 n=1 Tax=Electrophorus electricus TaxID=8005 RepID=UPI000F09BEE5|nr:histone deacetylase complex subunit SAP30L isoform X1 [Electrophorus electricus]
MNGFSTEEDSHDGPPAPPFYGQSCCLIEDGERCGRSAGNASFSKRIQKSISQKKLKLDIDKSVRHLYICDFHKNFIQSVRNKRKRKTSDDGGESPDHDVEVPEVDLFQLQVNTLRRYKRHYKIQTRPGLNKAQLAEAPSVMCPVPRLESVPFTHTPPTCRCVRESVLAPSATPTWPYSSSSTSAREAHTEP